MGKPIGSVVDLRQVATPGAPAAGITSLYSKSDSGLYIQSSTLGETRLRTDQDDIGGENLVNNSSFENAAIGGAVLGTASRYALDTSQFFLGTQSLKIAPLAGDTGNIGWRGDFRAIGVADGVSFVPSAQMRRAAGSGNFWMQVEWGDASLVSLGNATAFSATPTTGSWATRVKGSAVIAPANARYARVRFYYTSYVGGTDVMNIDAVQLERGDVPTDYSPPVDDMLNQRLQNLADPTAAQDAVTRNYAGLTYAPISGSANYAPASGSANYASSADPHLFRDVRAVQTANVSLASATVTVDGVTLVAGDRVLLTGQTAPAENGIYTVGAVSAGNAPLTRDTHFNTALLLANAGVIEVTEGTIYGGTAWITTFKTTNTVGTTAMNWYKVLDQSAFPANASIAQQNLAGAATYITRSDVNVQSSRLKAGSFYRCKLNVVKTAAGVNAPSVQVKMGTAGTIADTSQINLSLGAQTAVADEGRIEILVNFRAVGAATIIEAYITLIHRLSTTGLSVTGVFSSVLGASASFDSTTFTKMGITINPGTSASWNVDVVQAELLNLA